MANNWASRNALCKQLGILYRVEGSMFTPYAHCRLEMIKIDTTCANIELRLTRGSVALAVIRICITSREEAQANRDSNIFRAR